MESADMKLWVRMRMAGWGTGSAGERKAIRERLYEPEFSDLTVVDFSELAQGCRTYDAYIEKVKQASEAELNYFGIAICGAKKEGQ